LVGKGQASNPITPREWVVGRNIIETAPNGKKNIRKGVVCVMTETATSQIPLQRIEDLR
jgi:hypothetical protein